MPVKHLQLEDSEVQMQVNAARDNNPGELHKRTRRCTSSITQLQLAVSAVGSDCFLFHSLFVTNAFAIILVLWQRALRVTTNHLRRPFYTVAPFSSGGAHRTH